MSLFVCTFNKVVVISVSVTVFVLVLGGMQWFPHASCDSIIHFCNGFHSFNFVPPLTEGRVHTKNITQSDCHLILFEVSVFAAYCKYSNDIVQCVRRPERYWQNSVAQYAVWKKALRCCMYWIKIPETTFCGLCLTNEHTHTLQLITVFSAYRNCLSCLVVK